jgi:hypothetical protein
MVRTSFKNENFAQQIKGGYIHLGSSFFSSFGGGLFFY